MCERYIEQLRLARALTEAYDSHVAVRKLLAEGKTTEAQEFASFDRMRSARHALFDFHANLRTTYSG